MADVARDVLRAMCGVTALVPQQAISDVGFAENCGLNESMFVDANGQVQEINLSVFDVELGGELDVTVARVQELDESLQILLCSSEEQEEVINEPLVEIKLN